MVGAVSRGFAAKTITDGIDVFGGSLEGFIDSNAGGFELDFGVFETVV